MEGLGGGGRFPGPTFAGCGRGGCPLVPVLPCFPSMAAGLGPLGLFGGEGLLGACDDVAVGGGGPGFSDNFLASSSLYEFPVLLSVLPCLLVAVGLLASCPAPAWSSGLVFSFLGCLDSLWVGFTTFLVAVADLELPSL